MPQRTGPDPRRSLDSTTRVVLEENQERLDSRPRSLDELVAMGEESLARGRFPEAEILLRQAYLVACERSDSERAGRIGLRLSNALLEEGAFRASAGVLHSLTEVPLSPRLRGEWHLQMGHLLRGFCRPDLSDEHFDLSMRCAERTGGSRWTGYALIERASLQSTRGEVEGAARLFGRGLEMLRGREAEIVPTGIALTNMAANALHREDVGKALETLQRADRLRRESGSLKLSVIVDLHYAEVAVHTGDAALADTLCREVERTAEQAGMLDARSHTLVVRTALHGPSRATESIRELEEAAGRLRARGQYHETGMIHALAAVLAERCDLDPREHLDRARWILGHDRVLRAQLEHHRSLLAATDRRRGNGRPGDRSPGAPSPDPATLRVALFSEDPGIERRIQRRMRRFQGIVSVREWDRLERLVSAVDCLILDLPSLEGALVRRRVQDLERVHPFLPIVLVTAREADNVRHLAEVEVEEVLWRTEIDSSIRTAVVRASSRGLARWIARRLATSDRLDPELREGLVHALRSSEPVRTVGDLAGIVGCHRTTLARQWRRAVGSDTDLRLEDALAWILLLRAIGRKRPGEGWAHVAREIGIHEKTLRNYARHLTGRGLADLDRLDHRTAAERFERDVLHALVEPS